MAERSCVPPRSSARPPLAASAPMRTQRHPQRRPGPPACSREQRAVRRDLARRRLYRPRRLRWALGHAGRARGAPGQPAAQAASHANRPPSLRSWRPGINVGPLMASVGGAGVIIGLAGQSLMQVRGRRVSWRSVALLPPPPRSRVLMRPAERGLGAHAVHVTPLHRGGPHSAAGGRRAGGRGAWRQRRVAWWTWGGGSHAPPPPPPPPPPLQGEVSQIEPMRTIIRADDGSPGARAACGCSSTFAPLLAKNRP